MCTRTGVAGAVLSPGVAIPGRQIAKPRMKAATVRMGRRVAGDGVFVIDLFLLLPLRKLVTELDRSPSADPAPVTVVAFNIVQISKSGP
jgi:hypothetical protein